MKTVWIIDHYSSEPKHGGISRQYDFALKLSEKGYKVVIIASSFSHFKHEYFHKEEVNYTRINENAHYVYLRTTSYEVNNGFGRIKNMLSFHSKVVKYMNEIAEKLGQPDVVNGCSVHPFAWTAAYKVAKKFKSKFCIEVRDLWPEVWVLSGLKSETSPMVIFLRLLERFIYKKADRIIYSMRKGEAYFNGKFGVSVEKLFLIGQPMDTQRFDLNSEVKLNLLPENFKSFMNNYFICTFAGYYMKYEGVYTMLEAAKILQQDNLNIRMVFVGSGEEKEGMLKYVKDNKLNNVLISDRISKEAIPALLTRSEVVMAHLAVEDNEEAYKYGVSKNKVNEYLYSGAVTMYGFHDTSDVVASEGAGYVFEPFNSSELAKLIKDVYKMEIKERKKIGENGREFILRHHDSKILTNQLEEIFFQW